jgi:hypothetical protein
MTDKFLKDVQKGLRKAGIKSKIVKTEVSFAEGMEILLGLDKEYGPGFCAKHVIPHLWKGGVCIRCGQRLRK